MKDLAQKNREHREAALQAVYKVAEGRTNKIVLFEHIERDLGALGIGPADCKHATSYLVQSGLLKNAGAARWILTPAGIDEAERLATKGEVEAEVYELPTPVFNSVQHFHAGVGVVQTGSHNTANVVQQISEAGELLRYIAQLRQATATLSPEKSEAAIELVDTLEEQAKAEKPRKALVKQCAEGLKDYLVAYAPMIQMIVELFLKK